VEGLDRSKMSFEERAALVPVSMTKGLCQHATEEMAILARQLPGLYAKHSRNKL
jgi:hypothetical protein